MVTELLLWIEWRANYRKTSCMVWMAKWPLGWHRKWACIMPEWSLGVNQVTSAFNFFLELWEGKLIWTRGNYTKRKLISYFLEWFFFSLLISLLSLFTLYLCVLNISRLVYCGRGAAAIKPHCKCWHKHFKVLFDDLNCTLMIRFAVFFNGWSIRFLVPPSHNFASLWFFKCK